MQFEAPKFVKSISVALLLSLASSLHLPDPTFAQAEKPSISRNLDESKAFLEKKNREIDKLLIEKVGKKFAEITEKDFSNLDKVLTREEKEKLFKLLEETGNMANYISELELLGK